MNHYMKKLRERSRQMILRKIKKEEVTWSKKEKCFVYKETGLKVMYLKFKTKYIED